MKRILAALLFLPLLGVAAHAYPQYYDISDTPKAQAEARQRHLPIAYLGSWPQALTDSPDPGSVADLTQMALATLRDKAVIIFFDGANMAPVPALVHAQYHIHDDGDLPDGAAWQSPKIVFTDPDITKILGRVSATQMHSGRDIPLTAALQTIHNDPTALAQPGASAPAAATSPSGPDTVGNVISIVAWINDNILYLVMGALLLVALAFFALAGRKRE